MGLPLAVVVLLAAVLLLSEYAVGQSGRVVFEDDDNDKCPGHEPHCVYLQECPQALQQVRSGHHPKICDWVNKTTALICCATPTVYPVDETPFPPDIVPATDTKVVNPDTPVPPVTEPLPPVTEPLPPVVTEPPNIPTDDLDDCECEDPLPPSPATDGRNPSTVVRVPGEPTASTATCGVRPEDPESRNKPTGHTFHRFDNFGGHEEPAAHLDARRVTLRPRLRLPLRPNALRRPFTPQGYRPRETQRLRRRQRATQTSWPWMVSVMDELNPARRCAGVLISDRHVLTAAQCFSNYRGQNTVVELNVPGAPTLHRVIRARPHPGYQSPDGYNDIALARFVPRLSPNTLSPVCIPRVLNERIFNGSRLDAVSWTDAQRDFHPGSMSDRHFEVVPATSCNRSYAGVDLSPYPNGISEEEFICAQLVKRSGEECVGMPGSPLMVKEKGLWTIIGIYSFGVSCSGSAHYPTVFTRVTPFVSWIYEELGQR